MVNLTVDASQLRKLVRALGHIKDGVPKALVPAINRALDRGKTTVHREIRKVYLIKQKDIPMVVKGANAGNLTGKIIIESGMLPLDKFKVAPRGFRKRKGPIFAQVKVGGGGTMPGAFYIPTGGPFIRPGSDRYPIEKLHTIGAPIMASQPSVGPAANKAMGDSLDKEIDRNIKRVLASAGGK